MTIMSSFRLKTYINGSFQLSVSILTNTLVIFLQHLIKIRMAPSPVKHKQTKNTRQIQSHLKKVDISRFPVLSNEATHELNSVAVSKHGQNTPRSTKQWMNERLPKLVPASPAILKISWNKFRCKNLKVLIKFYGEVTKRNRDNNELESLKIMQSATQQYLKEKKTLHWASCSRGSFTTQKKSSAELHIRMYLEIPSLKTTKVSASTTEERKAFHHWFRRRELNCYAWGRLFPFGLQNCLFLCYAWMSFRHMTSFCTLNETKSISGSAINKPANGSIHQNLKFKVMKLCDFKMDLIKWQLNFVSCNFGPKSYLWFQIEPALRARSILKSRVWFQTKLRSTQFNYHY